MIAQLKIFDQVYLFSQGGRAAAVAVTLFVLVVVVSVLQFQLLRLARGRK
ncbi:hypothetical protein [Rhodobacter calidifons]|nr:hypothetical protein [Rhodobacter calidifons]